ncbi:unnamed protein product [Moneuplotes crassus]|uniref:Uncharacterized protein n=2 Tax=Euplotes crassus TaxID=5936 RepID=A0AAD2D8Q7_EUPCR|nr:unnamed protein product [Moneuplotes crassus]
MTGRQEQSGLPPVRKAAGSAPSEDTCSEVVDLEESLDELREDKRSTFSRFNRFSSVDALPVIESNMISPDINEAKIWPNYDKYQDLFESSPSHPSKKSQKRYKPKKIDIWPVKKLKKKCGSSASISCSSVVSKQGIPKSPDINYDNVKSKFYKQVEGKQEKEKRVKGLMHKCDMETLGGTSFTKDTKKEAFYSHCFEIIQKIEKDLQQENLERMHDNIKELTAVSLKVPDVTIIKNCYFALACYAEHCNKYQTALFAYGRLRSAAEGIMDYNLLYKSFIKRAIIYIKLKEYKYSLRMFKLILKYAWMEKNLKWEFEAYKGMAISYYYQGLLHKSYFYYNRYIKGKKEPVDSNLRIYSLKRYNNDYKLNYVNARKERTEYHDNMVHKIKDYTTDFSVACNFIDGKRNSQISKRSVYLKIEIPVEELKDKDLPSPSIENNSKGNLFIRMRKAKQIINNMKDENNKFKQKKKLSHPDEDSGSDSSELPVSEVEKLIDAKPEEKSKKFFLLQDDNSPVSLPKDTKNKVPFYKKLKKDPRSIDYLKIRQTEKQDLEKISKNFLNKISLDGKDKGIGTFHVSGGHKDSGKSKTNILISHLGLEEEDQKDGRKKAEILLLEVREHIEAEAKNCYIIEEKKVREITVTRDLYYCTL